MTEHNERNQSIFSYLQEHYYNDKKIFRPLKGSTTLNNLLHLRTKSDLDNIRVTIGIGGASKLKKNELVELLESHIREALVEFLPTITSHHRDILIDLLRNQPEDLTDNTLYVQTDFFQRMGIVFPFSINGKPSLVIPKELIPLLSESTNHKYKEIAEVNSAIVHLTKGMLHHYGTLDLNRWSKLVAELLNVDEDSTERWHTLLDYTNIWDDILGVTGRVLYNKVVDEPWQIYHTHLNRTDIDYFRFTKEQLIEAANVDYLEKTPALTDFIRTMKLMYSLDEEQQEDLAFEADMWIREDISMQDFMEQLQEQFEIPDRATFEIIADKVVLLMNHTRRYVLKGHSPISLRLAAEKASNVVSLADFKKVKRNDPCPCGSGKKFKKCCGK